MALCCLDETRQILLCRFPPPSALHIPNLREIASGIPEICDFKKWLSFFVFFFFLFFFLFSHTYKNCYKTRTRYPIALKFDTQKGGIKAHLDTNFGWNTINRQRVMSDYARKITPICDWACENRACGHMIFAYFFKRSSLITFCTIMLWQCNFEHLVRI